MSRLRIFWVIICITGCLSGLNAQLFNEQTYKFGKVLEWIDEYYVDSVNQPELVEHAITALLKELDPHSSYLSSEEVSAMNEPLQGNFEGIGVSFNILDDTVYVIAPITDGPSDKAGIHRGDRIVKVDDKNVAGVGITTEQVYTMLRGKKGSHVKLTIQRRGVPGYVDFDISRDKIPIYSVEAAYKADDEIGYIKINRFSMTTLDEYSRAIAKLKDDGVKDLILDLTGNGGGYLEVAIRLADHFLDAGKLILYTEGVNSPRKEYTATREGNFEKGKLVVLIDEGSASASEILSGAIQDWDRGIIIGRRSYGKGLVQKPLLLPDQSMIRLTIAKYYTPTGRLIQKPYNMSRDEYEKDLLNRYNHGEFVHRDSIHFPDSLKYYTLKNTRPVYGGGGIMPDYFVSLDTSHYSDYYRQLNRNRVIDQFVLKYVDRNRKQLLQAYPDMEIFNAGFSPDESFMSRFFTFAEEKGVSYNEKEYTQSAEQIKMLLKAYIARDLWSTSEFYEISNLYDPKFETALTVLKNWDKYDAMLLNEK
ncbi:MAG: S41 family peptidase [Bacteroidales bacterium]|nr:S41 family peptidase [Bacteroidales bacterium]MBN2813520.1 S41 family peptidase [Bacteroidales bacterium]